MVGGRVEGSEEIVIGRRADANAAPANVMPREADGRPVRRLFNGGVGLEETRDAGLVVGEGTSPVKVGCRGGIDGNGAESVRSMSCRSG